MVKPRFRPENELDKAFLFSYDADIHMPTKRNTTNKKDDGYWAQASSAVDWLRPWKKLRQGRMPKVSWFVGGKLNVSANCLDRHLTNNAKKTAIIWEAEDGKVRKLTYYELYEQVNRCADGLRKLGVKKGQRVTLYMGLVPEAVVAMLACTRIGAPHVVVFGGFGSDALAKRIQDSGSKVLITCESASRRGKTIPLKQNADAALMTCPTVKKVIVVRHDGAPEPAKMKRGRDLWWDDVLARAETYIAPRPMDAEDLLFILHTSGTTGKPKGIMHTTAGYLVGAVTSFRHVFGIRPDDVYWCTADIGWITGHSYVVYAPLACGSTVFLYEGALDWPDPGRVWKLCEKHHITIFYTAPTAIRSFMRTGFDLPKKYDLSSLRLLGSVGEPINPEAWHWYRKQIGHGKCPIMDTWWQTETGMIMLAPDLKKQKPGSASHPLPGVSAKVVDDSGRRIASDQPGHLVITEPWPSMLRGIWRDPKRFRSTYWSQIRGAYFTHDRARQDEDGDFWILGREDDILIVSGHNMSNAEIEAALTEHPSVVEAAVVGIPDTVTGQRLIAFVVQKMDAVQDAELIMTLNRHMASAIGPIAKPKEYFFVPELPKTRSGKIMRRLLRQIVIAEEISETTTLANPEAVALIAKAVTEQINK